VSDDGEVLRTRVDQLTSRLGRIESRLDRIEQALPGFESSKPIVHQVEQKEVTPLAPAVERSTIWREATPLIGRTLVVLAGAFALRALTETEILPQIAGVFLGLLYGLVWVALAFRTATRGHSTSAEFHGLAAALIAFPLLGEVTIKFGLFSPELTAGLLVVVTAAGLLVAGYQRLRGMAWVFVLGAAATSVMLAVSTKSLVLYTCCLLLLGVGALWLGLLRNWRGIAWFTAVLVEAMVLVTTLIALQVEADRVAEILTPVSLVRLQLLLAVAYLGSFALRTFTSKKGISTFEILHGIVVLAAGLGGAIAVSRAFGLSGIPAGAVGLVLAAGCYAASFSVIDTDERGNFIFFSSAALAATLVGCSALFRGPVLAVAFSATALIAAWLGFRHSRATLSLHGAVYTVAAMVASGVLAVALRAMAGHVPEIAAWETISGAITLVVAAIYCTIPIATHGRTWGRFSEAPRLLVLAALVLGIDGLAVSLGLAILPASPDGTLDAGALAALRTAALSISVLALGLLGRRGRFAHLHWLVYAILILGGFKLLLEDLRVGRATTLIVSLAAYGAALLLAPKLVRRSG